MNNVHRPEAAEFGTVTVASATFGSTHARRTITTSCADPLTALELLRAWGTVPGPDLADPRSVFERRPLAARGGMRVHHKARTGRRAAECRPSATACADDAKPHNSAGAITVWSANAPPVPPSA
jgi:hypothetical protein